VDFSYPAEAEAFRAELRQWLERNLDDRIRAAGGHLGARGEQLEILREWNHRLADAGYAAISWPVEYGGRGAGVMEQVVWTEEMHRARAPATLNPIGLSNIAPAIMQHGSEEQKRRYLPRMLRGDDIWCQGFSEPDAGSDLASLRTSAVREGGHYLVTGQKIWNTLGDVASHCELLVRTDPQAPRHRGISCLLVDMRLPGVSVRPIVTISGEESFYELFFDRVRVPRSALLGPENEGWRVAMTTLNHERGGVASLHLQVRQRIRDLIEAARALEIGGRPATREPALRERLAHLYLEGELLKLLSDRAISALVHGRSGAEGSLVKLVWSHVDQRTTEVASDVSGPEGLHGERGRLRLYARSYTLAGGTTQVNKNVVAQRVLGLPRSG
jgi:alkylation response protein AidB-like acyl-CoA dehydrogenase